DAQPLKKRSSQSGSKHFLLARGREKGTPNTAQRRATPACPPLRHHLARLREAGGGGRCRRAGCYELYGRLTDRLGRALERLGIERKPRDVGPTFSDLWRADQEERRRATQSLTEDPSEEEPGDE